MSTGAVLLHRACGGLGSSHGGLSFLWSRVRGELKFCPECAAPLGVPARQVAEERKVVSVVFCDLVGFTASRSRRIRRTWTGCWRRMR